jgi:hypothetical protein
MTKRVSFIEHNSLAKFAHLESIRLIDFCEFQYEPRVQHEAL